MKQKTKVKVGILDIGRIYYNIEINEEKRNDFSKEIETIKRAIRKRKRLNGNYQDLSLRKSELKNSKIHYKNDKLVINDILVELGRFNKNILMKK